MEIVKRWQWVRRFSPRSSLGNRFTLALLITVLPIIWLAALSVQGVRTTTMQFEASSVLTDAERIPLLQLQGALKSGPGIGVILGMPGARQAYRAQQATVNRVFVQLTQAQVWGANDERLLTAQRRWRRAEQVLRVVLTGQGGSSGKQLALGSYSRAVDASRAALGPLISSIAADSRRNLAAVQDEERRQIPLALLAVVVTLAAALGAAIWLRRAVVGRVRQLVKAVEGLEQEGALPPAWPDELGEVAEALALLWQAVQAQRAELRDHALHDPLTGLGNRRLVTDLDSRPLTALVMLDLDDFKTVNDVLGHEAGDEFLRVMARRLTGNVGAADAVIRLGGDEFAVLVHDPAGREDLDRLAKRLLKVLAQPVHLGRRDWSARASVGIALACDLVASDGTSPSQQLLTAADLAMYSRKRSGKHGITFYEPSMQERLLADLDLEGALAAAIETGGLTVYYQPLVDLARGTLVGAEALVRWQHPTRGLISPDAFIPIAERSDLIVALGWDVVDVTLEQVAVWRNRGVWPDQARMAVNISPRHFACPDFVDGVRGLLDQHGLPGSVLTVEITETTAMVDVALSKLTLNALHGLGVQVAIDDFGTGYTTLGHLAELHPDIVKIDRSFLEPARYGQNSSVVRAILALARSLKLQAVGEGVETAAQRDWLRSERCEIAQGFFFSRPVPGPEFEASLLASVPAQPVRG